MNGRKLRRAGEDLPLLLNLPLLAALLGGKCRFKGRCRSEIPNELFYPKYSLTSCHSGQSVHLCKCTYARTDPSRFARVPSSRKSVVSIFGNSPATPVSNSPVRPARNVSSSCPKHLLFKHLRSDEDTILLPARRRLFHGLGLHLNLHLHLHMHSGV